MDGSQFTPKLYDFLLFKCEEEFCIFMVMEYIPHDLTSIDVGKLSDEDLKILVYNIVCAVSYVHSANVLHRDLKPQNVLVSKNLHVKICDFGISNTVHMRKSNKKGNKMYGLATDSINS